MTLKLVPAGTEAYTATPSQLFIRNGANEKEITHFGKKCKRWDTLDKTVFEISGSSVGHILPKGKFDLSIPMFSPSFIKMCGLDLILANPEVGKAYVKGPFYDAGIKTILDSGGFQMLKGTSDFIHPDLVISRYNENADIGMPLDLPLRSGLEPLYFDAISHLIKANDDYILPKLNKDIDLCIVSHGLTLDQRKRRLDVLDRPTKAVAIAGLGAKVPNGVDKPINSVQNLMYVTSRYRKTTDYFHVLGVTAKFWLFIYALLDQSNYVKNIGADSVSHRVAAMIGQYELLNFNTLDLSKNVQYKTFPICSCPICFAVGDFRILHSWRVLEAHNLWVWAKRTEQISYFARSFLKAELSLEYIYKTLDLSMPLSKFTMLVDYVMEVVSDKFKPLRVDHLPKSLFRGVDKEVQHDPHYLAVIQRYEKFHGKSFLKKQAGSSEGKGKTKVKGKAGKKTKG
jgi:hypothetical protein